MRTRLPCVDGDADRRPAVGALRPAGLRRLDAVQVGVGGEPVTELDYPAGSLVLVGGVPGAGKTTLLRRLAVAAPGPVRVLDPEAWRSRLSRVIPPGVPYRLWRPLVHLLHYATAAAALRGGGSLLVHETATRPVLRRWLAGLARRSGRQAHLLLLDVDLPAARHGQVARDRVLGRRPFRRHWRRWLDLRDRLLAQPSAGVLGREGWASCMVCDRRAADRLTRVVFD